MRKNEVLAILAEHREELRTVHRVKSLSLFGSFARDEAGPDSDVDLLVEFSAPVGLLHLAGLQLRLESLMGRPVDLVTREGLKRQMRDRVVDLGEIPA